MEETQNQHHEENIMNAIQSKQTAPPLKSLIFAAALALTTMTLLANKDPLLAHFQAPVHFAEDSQTTFGLQGAAAHPKKGGFTHVLQCYQLVNKYSYQHAKAFNCPAGKYLKLYNYDTSRTKPEIQGKLAGGQKSVFYNYEYFASRETVRGRVCAGVAED